MGKTDHTRAFSFELGQDTGRLVYRALALRKAVTGKGRSCTLDSLFRAALTKQAERDRKALVKRGLTPEQVEALELADYRATRQWFQPRRPPKSAPVPGPMPDVSRPVPDVDK